MLALNWRVIATKPFTEYTIPMIAMLKPGISKVTAGGQATYFVTGEGYCEITRAGVSVLVDTFGTGKVEAARLTELVRENFPLTPKDEEGLASGRLRAGIHVGEGGQAAIGDED